jgi:hypothetical protein
MTIQLCHDECVTSSATNTYFGITQGRNCFCSDAAPSLTEASATECYAVNSGANSEAGGAVDFESVWGIGAENTGNSALGTTTPTGGEYIGCLAAFIGGDPNTPLFGPPIGSPATQEECLAACSTNIYFAIGNGDICYCADTYSLTDADPGLPEECTLTNSIGEAAGDVDRISVFRNTGIAVRTYFFTLCSKLCSANMKTYEPG